MTNLSSHVKEEEDKKEDDCPKKVCTKQMAPVCGNDGHTYNSQCILEMEACKKPALLKVYDGECTKPVTEKADECAKTCPTDKEPVCDNHGKSYRNKCYLQVAACRDKSITSSYKVHYFCAHIHIDIV